MITKNVRRRKLRTKEKAKNNALKNAEKSTDIRARFFEKLSLKR